MDVLGLDYGSDSEDQSSSNLDLQQHNTIVSDKEINEKYKHLATLTPIDPNALPDKNTADSVNYYLNAIKAHDFNLTENIRGNKDFGNPYILLNVVDHFKIDERGSNYPPEIFDPHGYPESDYQSNIFKSNAPQPTVTQTTQPVCAVASAMATTASVMSSLQQQLANKPQQQQQQQSQQLQQMNRTSSYNQQLSEITTQNKQFTSFGSSSFSNQQPYDEDDYTSAIHAHVANSVSNANLVSLSATSTDNRGDSSRFSTSTSTNTFVDRNEKKRKSKWDVAQ